LVQGSFWLCSLFWDWKLLLQKWECPARSMNCGENGVAYENFAYVAVSRASFDTKLYFMT
jgi:hypothetical protein